MTSRASRATDRLRHAALTLATLPYDRRAVTALEYGLIAAAVVAVGLAGFGTVGTRLATKITSVKNALT